MTYDFSKPQRQSIAGIVIMAANYLYQIIKASIIPIVLVFIKVEREKLFYIFIGIAVLTLIALVFSYLSYRKFTFYLDSTKQEFIINKGIFNRTLLTIQLDKIQQVNINQSFLQKIIGVFSLKIDTPGGDSNEVSINAIDEKIAYSLKEHLLNGQKIELKDSIEEEITLQEQAPFLKLDVGTLFKVGLTSNYGSSLLVLTGFIYAIFHNAKDLLRAFDTDNGQVEAAIKTGVSLFSVGILVALFLGILLVINIVRTFITYFDFKVSKHKLSLLLSSGLLAKKNTLLNPKKVQTTTYSQNYFQKKFNLINFSLKQAASGEQKSDSDAPKSTLQVPGCSTTERDELLIMILGKIPEKGAFFAPNYRFLNLPILFLTILPIGIFYVFWFNFQEIKGYYPLTIVYFFVTILMIFISYKRNRLIVNQDFIIKKSGIWDISKEIIVPHKIQAITTFQYPWHKGVDVGHVNLHTAAGIIHFKYGNYTEIKQLVNYWLYQIESGSEEWM
ncbi:MAG: PH domain-containing protein [Bacteroidota bacterium]